MFHSLRGATNYLLALTGMKRKRSDKKRKEQYLTARRRIRDGVTFPSDDPNAETGAGGVLQLVIRQACWLLGARLGGQSGRPAHPSSNYRRPSMPPAANQASLEAICPVLNLARPVNGRAMCSCYCAPERILMENNAWQCGFRCVGCVGSRPQRRWGSVIGWAEWPQR